MTLHPIIDPEIFALRPDFVALSILVSGGRNCRNRPVGTACLMGG